MGLCKPPGLCSLSSGLLYTRTLPLAPPPHSGVHPTLLVKRTLHLGILASRTLPRPSTAIGYMAITLAQ